MLVLLEIVQIISQQILGSEETETGDYKDVLDSDDLSIDDDVDAPSLKVLPKTFDIKTGKGSGDLVDYVFYKVKKLAKKLEVLGQIPAIQLLFCDIKQLLEQDNLHFRTYFTPSSLPPLPDGKEMDQCYPLLKILLLQAKLDEGQEKRIRQMVVVKPQVHSRFFSLS